MFISVGLLALLLPSLLCNQFATIKCGLFKTTSLFQNLIFALKLNIPEVELHREHQNVSVKEV
jgi:hypothetical protein